MIVAREDGTVEVYNFETTDEPILKYTYVRFYITFSKIRFDKKVYKKQFQVNDLLTLPF